MSNAPLVHRICQPRADQGWYRWQLSQCADIWELQNSPLLRREEGKIRDDSRRKKHISTYPTGMGRNLVAKNAEEADLPQLCPHSFQWPINAPLQHGCGTQYPTVYIEFSLFCADFHSLSFLLWLLLPETGEERNKKLQTERSVGVRGFMCALVPKLWPEKRYLR